MKKQIKNRLFKIPPLIVAIFMTIGSYAQQARLQEQPPQSTELQIHFRAGKSVVEPGYMNNSVTLSRIAATFTSENTPYISSLRIEGFASPEGVTSSNERLSSERSEALKRYIITNFPHISPAIITVSGMGENWEGLRKLVENDHNTPQRESVLRIIDNVPAEIDYRTNTSRKKSLMDLGTETWNYMLANHFPLLRTGCSMTVIVKSDTPKEIVSSINNTLNGIDNQEQVLPAADTIRIIERITDTVFIARNERLVGKPLFALKTNLLFDLASALNVEIEIPIGRRWSIAAEYIFPWWLWERRQIALQTLSGNIEGRYWFGNRDEKPQLTGWFAGLYAGGGYYDFEWKDKGYQGEFYIAAGVSGGYAHTINKKGTLRMEYSLGVGYLDTKYREYKPMTGVDGEWHLIRQRNGNHSWFGPTRAKVSLVWMLNHGYKKEGGSR